ncbi:YqgQ family protein [Macrococcus brunensis]|uniref:YqgQ family protein n=1 Tax=Macrococcus brunensis TaxID=198483 RepID=UPI001EF03B74|nr:YqgQ family protein [Macrococcus brunensis]ULG73435.1 YqgQ family protein [Macrococcus brunensis]
MKSFYDVQQLLKKFGLIIYFKDEHNTIEMMNQELKDIHQSGLISNEDFIQARLILNQRKMGKL